MSDVVPNLYPQPLNTDPPHRISLGEKVHPLGNAPASLQSPPRACANSAQSGACQRRSACDFSHALSDAFALSLVSISRQHRAWESRPPSTSFWELLSWPPPPPILCRGTTVRLPPPAPEKQLACGSALCTASNLRNVLPRAFPHPNAARALRNSAEVGQR